MSVQNGEARKKTLLFDSMGLTSKVDISGKKGEMSERKERREGEKRESKQDAGAYSTLYADSWQS